MCRSDRAWAFRVRPSVPFEMAVAPYLPEGVNTTVWMVAYSLVFFMAAWWLCMNPGKLVNRIGSVLTPSLLILLVFLFVNFVARGQVSVAEPQVDYQQAAASSRDSRRDIRRWTPSPR